MSSILIAGDLVGIYGWGWGEGGGEGKALSRMRQEGLRQEGVGEEWVGMREGVIQI